ncbi:MAG: hypothetical protein ACI4VE_03320 [Clostridia bacterium]
MNGIYVATAILTVVLGLTVYFTNVKLAKNKIISFILTISTMILMESYIAARAQLVTFILFVLTIYFIESFLETGKKRYAIGLIIIPILIANIHLAVFPFYFILYMPYIVEYLIYLLTNMKVIKYKRKIKKLNQNVIKDENIENEIANLEENLAKEKAKKEVKSFSKLIVKPSKYVVPLIIIMIICIFTGLLTPLKDTPYTYLIKTMQGNTTHNISEHLPLVLIQHIGLLVLIEVYLVFLIFTDTKIRLSNLFLIAGLLLLALMTRRQESMFVLLGVFVLNRLITSFILKYDDKGIKELERVCTKPIIMVILTIIIAVISAILYKNKMNDEYVLEKDYPVQASIWINENLDVSTMKLFNEYNYGSYLLFNDIPVFIDSRADLYAPEFNGKKDIFTDFINLNCLNCNIQEKLDEYGFTHIILKEDAKLNIYFKLKTDTYKNIYSDENFVIYEKI